MYEEKEKKRLVAKIFSLTKKIGAKKIVNEENLKTSNHELNKVVAYWVERASLSNDEKISDAMKSLSSAFKYISKYDPSIAKTIVYSLGWIAYSTKSEKAVLAAANCISKHKDEIAKIVALHLADVADSTKSERAVLDVTKSLSSDVVLNCISKYEEEIAEKIMYWICKSCTNDEKVTKMAKSSTAENLMN